MQFERDTVFNSMEEARKQYCFPSYLAVWAGKQEEALKLSSYVFW